MIRNPKHVASNRIKKNVECFEVDGSFYANSSCLSFVQTRLVSLRVLYMIVLCPCKTDIHQCDRIESNHHHCCSGLFFRFVSRVVPF